jgi:hypothetical protein
MSLATLIKTIALYPRDELLMITLRRITRENGDVFELPSCLSEHWLRDGSWELCSFVQVYASDLLNELQEMEAA